MADLTLLMVRACYTATSGIDRAEKTAELNRYSQNATVTVIEAIGSRETAIEMTTELAVKQAMAGCLRTGRAEPPP
ncbi:MAG: hypothetical protein OXG35_07080 [Acidobacteria bacterium]|nr:hypothetical protein [Acidobacteriota bacterium]